MSVRILLFTYNCGQERHLADNIRDGLRSFLSKSTRGFEATTIYPDLIFLSLQEIGSISDCFLWGNTSYYLEPFIEAVTDGALFDDSSYALVENSYAGLTFGLLFRRIESDVTVSNARKSSISFGYLETGLKGAGSIRVDLKKPSDVSPGELSMDGLTFIAAHFAANEGFKTVRDDNFFSIARKTAFFPKKKLHEMKFSDREFLYRENSNIFILGDLNYRVALERPPIDSAPKWQPPEKTFVESWLKKDELKKSIANSDAFIGFEEAPITFAPTYKFSNTRSNDRDVKDYSKKRVPSWTDRVLYLCVPNTISYDSIPSIVGSDHIPVASLVSLPFVGSSKKLTHSTMENLIEKNVAVQNESGGPFDLDVDEDVQVTSDTSLAQIRLQDLHISARKRSILVLEVLIGIIFFLFYTKAGNIVLASIIIGVIGRAYWMHSV
ncbi:Endonuclease/exonuclease/phosphatase [Dipodascopsis uninucleata]